MGRSLLCVLELFLLKTLLTGHVQGQQDGDQSAAETTPAVSKRVSVTLQPSWSQIFSGEKITITCEIEGGGGSEWTYEWRTTTISNRLPTNGEFRIDGAAESDSGDYSCRAKRHHSFTQWSDVIRLTVSGNKPKPNLTADNNNIIPVGGAVTLTCSVEGSDWKYYWYRRPSQYFYYRGIKDGAPEKVIRVTEKGVYSCGGGRGEPSFYTEFSDEVTIQETGNKRKPKLTADNNNIIPVGGAVTLTCSVEGSDWEYYWVKRTSGSSQYQTIKDGAPENVIGVTEEGLYSCRGGRRDPSFYTDISNEVTIQHEQTAVSRPESSSLPVSLIVRPVCWIVFIVPVMIFCHYRLSKTVFIRPSQPESPNQSSAASHVVNQDEAERAQNSTLLHGDSCVYESIGGSEDYEDVDQCEAAESSV